MRTIRLRVILYCAILFTNIGNGFTNKVEAQVPHKRALLIGVHAYARPNDETFCDLNTESDVTAIKQVLMQHFQFKASEIKVLTAKQDTTRAAILSAIRTFLITPTKPGDIVYFHYSGHGSQADDPKDPSGVDETLVPSDWTHDGSRDIRDKEISALLKEMKKKQPGNVTLTFDCCHSGTITRGSRSLVRGVSYEKRYGHPRPQSMGIATRGKSPTGSANTFLHNEAQDVGYVVISACSDAQCAMETETETSPQIAMGRLSYLLTTALKDAGPMTTYEDIYERIDSMMRADYADDSQTPQIEGDKDKVLLGSLALAPVSYNRISVDTDGNIVMDAGALQGVTKGSVFTLYPPGTKSFAEAKPIANASVQRVTATESYMSIIKKPRPDFKLYDLSATRAIETDHAYGDNRIRIDPHDFDGLPEAPAILNLLGTLSAVTTQLAPDEKPDIRFLHTEPLSLVRTEGGSEIAVLSPGAGLPVEIEQAIKREVTWEFAKSLNNQQTNSPVKIEVRMIPAVVTGDDTNGIQFAHDKPLIRGPLTFSDGDYATLEVRNLGNVDVHIAILDLSGDGTVEQIWPTPNRDISDNIIKHGAPQQWQKLWDPENPTQPAVIALGKPYGTDIFKAIATEEKVDFSRLSMPNRAIEKTPLDQLLHAGLIGQRAAIAVTPSVWSTSTVTVDIQPKSAQ